MAKRGRAWRRYKDYTKAKRKRDIDLHVNWWPTDYTGFFNNEFLKDNWKGYYRHLHQYSKNKIHCSCPMCRAKTKRNDRFIVGRSYTMADLRKLMRMLADENEYFNSEESIENL